jgi:hypothetical protein
MKRYHFGSLVAAGVVTAATMLTLTAPAAQATPRWRPPTISAM